MHFHHYVTLMRVLRLFYLQIIKNQVSDLSLEDAQNYVVEMTRQMMVKDNLVKHLVKADVKSLDLPRFNK